MKRVPCSMPVLYLASVLVSIAYMSATAAEAPDAKPAGQTFVLPPLADGVYVLTVKSGAATVTKAIMVTTDVSPPPPQPPPPGPTPTLQSEATRLGNLVVDPTRATSAKAIGALYSEISKLAADGQVGSVDQLKRSTDFLYSSVIRAAGKETAWKPWKTGIDKAVAAEGFSSVGQYVDGWDAIATGLQAVTNAAKGGDK